MYKIPHFNETDEEKVIAFMKQQTFVVITGNGEAYPVATHIPIETAVSKDGKIVLSGHMMKKTDHHLAFEKDPNVLVIFNGPHCYVSARWYNDQHTASTWNYMTVHAKGKLQFTDDAGTYEAIKAVTNKYEGLETTAAFNQLPQAYITPMLKAIVGFTIEVEAVENVFKLSQNKDEGTRIRIIDGLKALGDENALNIAKEMEARLQNLNQTYP